MNTLREAAQQVFEALSPLANAHTPIERECLTDEDSERAMEALVALEAALAEPQTTHSADCYKWHHECAIAEVKRLRAALAEADRIMGHDDAETEWRDRWAHLFPGGAEPVQEPVAWMTPGEHFLLNNTEGFRFSDWTPLYTAPPQRKPLTDEEIGNAANSVKWSQQYHVDFARAIERAHGIGGQDE